mmetsp:Transcript_11807/g.33257  ORF Transcript_11807/g.33257 Transcript_11807/m.33257 type:complete len:265 (-) Transcript_11807:1528-2322(-)
MGRGGHWYGEEPDTTDCGSPGTGVRLDGRPRSHSTQLLPRVRGHGEEGQEGAVRRRPGPRCRPPAPSGGGVQRRTPAPPPCGGGGRGEHEPSPGAHGQAREVGPPPRQCGTGRLPPAGVPPAGLRRRPVPRRATGAPGIRTSVVPGDSRSYVQSATRPGGRARAAAGVWSSHDDHGTGAGTSSHVQQCRTAGYGVRLDASFPSSGRRPPRRVRAPAAGARPCTPSCARSTSCSPTSSRRRRAPTRLLRTNRSRAVGAARQAGEC